ncbi:MAG: hypothetical protein M3A44_05305 [Gammaproteobacteria bacterium]
MMSLRQTLNFIPGITWGIFASAFIFCSAIISPSKAMADEEDFQWLDDEMLDTLRGGFVTSDGLQINFSIERAVIIDGGLVSRTVIDFPQSKITNDHQGDMASIFPSGFMTLVQNSLDFKTIQNYTLINAEISNLRALALGALHSSLSDQIAASIR